MQPGETAKAFHAFSHYRDFQPAGRSIDAAYTEHQRSCQQDGNGTKTVPGFWRNWSAANRWVDRTAAHDADLSRQRRERRARDLEEAQDALATLAQSGVLRLEQRLQTLDVDEIPAASIPPWFRALADVWLRSLGHQDRMAVEHSAPGGGPVVFTLELSPEEAEARAKVREPQPPEDDETD